MTQYDLASRLMAEHVEMPGFPQLIVTRDFLYHWLAARGWNKSERGYGSLDYAAFGRDAIEAPLTDESERDYWLKQVEEGYRR